ncbi:CopG family transcriptional regulator [Halobacteriales archaeon QS_1_68_17]|nr:MAG: CopG family transcriptional regulator [Halobacteriales archaeon QS_1_68_17]
MSKITFRADEELVERLERFDASKSEVMRRALRTYLDEQPAPRRLGGVGGGDLNLTISLEGASDASVERSSAGRTASTAAGESGDPIEPSDDERTCGGCGTSLDADHVYCPNCGEKASRRVFCECGDELRSDWGFCPGCGRRTPAADVLDGS